MARYNLLDPYQEQEFIDKSVADGISIDEVISYVDKEKRSQIKVKQLGIDIGKQDLEATKLKRDLKSEQSGSFDATDLGVSDRKIYNAVVSANQAKDILVKGLNTGPIASIGSSVGAFFNKTSDYTDYKSKLQLATSALKSSLLGASQSPQEIKGLIDALPVASDQEAIALQKLNNFINIYKLTFGEGAFEESQPGLDIGQQAQAQSQPQLTQEEQIDAPPNTEPAINALGEIASYGDLIEAPDGSLGFYGDANDKSTVFKTTQSGGEIDNALIEWLANSEFLPITGSIAGAFVGAGIASVGTGAAGAVAGKMMQQGLREMLDPERQDMSDMAQAVLIEGVTDALLGGTFFAIGKGAKVGLKLVLGKGAKETVKTGTKAAGRAATKGVGKIVTKTIGKESIESVAKSAGKAKTIKGLVTRGLEVRPVQDVQRYANRTGSNLVDDIMVKFGIPKSGSQLAEEAGKLRKSSSKKLKGLFSGKTANTAEVVSELESFKIINSTAPGGAIEKGLEAGSKEIDGFIVNILEYGDEIPLENLNRIKLRMQDVLTATGTFQGVTKASKTLQKDAAKMVKEFVESFHPEIAGTNKEKQLGYFAQIIGKKLDNKKIKPLFDFTDLVVGLTGGPGGLILKRGIEHFTRVFDNLMQARLIEGGLQMAVSNGNKQGVRNILRFANSIGLDYTATGIRGAAAGAGASAITENITKPGLDIKEEENSTQEEIQPGFMYR